MCSRAGASDERSVHQFPAFYVSNDCGWTRLPGGRTYVPSVNTQHLPDLDVDSRADAPAVLPGVEYLERHVPGSLRDAVAAACGAGAVLSPVSVADAG